jgi:hypothetical protein
MRSGMRSKFISVYQSYVKRSGLGSKSRVGPHFVCFPVSMKIKEESNIHPHQAARSSAADLVKS